MKINKETLYNLYIKQKLSTRKIGNIFNVSNTTISRTLKKLKIKVIPPKKHNIPIDKIKYLHLIKHETLKEIAKKYGCLYETISRHLRQNNIKIKTYSRRYRKIIKIKSEEIIKPISKYHIIKYNKKLCSYCLKKVNVKNFSKNNTYHGYELQCKTCLNKKAKLYRIKNHRKIRIKSKKYRNSIKGIYVIIKDNSAKIRNIPFHISLNAFEKWYKNQPQICYYCKRTLEEIKRDKHHKKTDRLTIDRKNNDRGYYINNIVLACWICNNVKSRIFSESEMLKIGKVLNKLL